MGTRHTNSAETAEANSSKATRMEESAPLATTTTTTTATGARRARNATAKRRMVPTAMAAVMGASAAPRVQPDSNNNNATGASAASSTSAGLDAHNFSSGAESVAFAPSVAHVRNFGRLKSFSSRQRVMPAMQKVARSAGPATASTTRNTPSSGRTHHFTTPVGRNVRVALSGDAERVMTTTRHQVQEEEESKENSSTVSVPLQLQQPSQVSVAGWDDSSIASSNESSPSGMQPRQPQRMRCLKLKSTVYPDLVMPYLYGDRKSRINTIMQETGCTIDYCPMSPDEEAQSPQSRAYFMNFLISAESAENLEEAIRMLRALVEKVEAHLQKKMRIRSLHASSSFRQLEADRPGADYSDETQERLLFSGGYNPEYVKDETHANAERHEAARQRHPISPVSLETPIEAYRQHSSVGRHREEINRNLRQDRGARIAVQFDDDIAYYDRWGRPVYRQEFGVNVEEFEPGTDSEAAREVPSVPYRDQVSRMPPQRRWQYADDSGWGRQSRGYVHVAPVEASEGRGASPSGATRRRKTSIHRRYAPYRHSDMYDDDEFEEDHRGRSGSRDGARVSSFQAARYSNFENEDILEHEEDILAAQEFALNSRAQPTSYAGRRGAKRAPGQFREASPSSYQQKLAAPLDANLRRPYEIFEGQDGEWLSDDEDHGIVYRRYRYSRQPAVLYPHRGYQAAKAPRRRIDDFSLSAEHPRTDQAENLDAGTSKRQKMSSESQAAGIHQTEGADLQVQTFAVGARSDDPGAIAVADDGIAARGDNETAHRPAHYNLTIDTTAAEAASQHLTHGGVADESTRLEKCEQPQISTEAAADLVKSPLGDDEQMGGEQTGGKAQQLQDCELVVDVADSAIDPAGSITDGAAADVNQDLSAQDRAAANDSAPSTLFVSIPGCDQVCGEETSTLTDHSPETPVRPSANPTTGSVKRYQGGECTDVLSAETQAAPITQLHSSMNNPRIRANEMLVASLRQETSLEVECVQAQEEVKTHLTRYLSTESNSKLLARLDELSRAVFDLQCQVVSSSCKLDTSTRRRMLDILDDALQTSARSEKSTQDKIDFLRDGIENALSLCSFGLSVETEAQESAGEDTHVAHATQSPEIAPDAAVFEDPASDDNNWDNANGWFEDADDHYETEPFEEVESVATDANPAEARGQPLVPKKEEDVTPSPVESPSFTSSLFSETSLCSPTSFVMKGMQKRLFGEIERAHSYYYLHPVKLADPPETLKPRSTCEFGCPSGSSGGWVQKVTSQISSRMKWFDEITYSLARARSGGGAEAGAELLNRKKMNSTIRKLHLMAIQLHCLVSHLYCVRGRAECKEGDSLTAALNGSYFERRMTAYKSKLKLDADLHGTPEELLRDTFEFFPEFLLCIEMWGYDYREGTTGGSSGSGDVNRIRKSVKALPLGFFERVESAVFDYELDKNGFLQTICEELLSIVCLWNDFVWSDNLQTLPVERIALFEAEMKKSVAKILQTYSLHLMGSWAVRLMSNPDELHGLRFTQQNAYYAESSKIRGLASSSNSQAVGKSSAGAAQREEAGGAGEDDDEAVANYWRFKTEVKAGRLEIQDNPSSELSYSAFSVDAIEKWGKEASAAHLLKWSRVFQLRGELETCGIVLNDLAESVSLTELSSADACDVSSADPVAAELLRLVGKSRVVGADVAAMSEAIALHSASIQQKPHEAAAEVPKGQLTEPAVTEAEQEGDRTEEPNGEPASPESVDDKGASTIVSNSRSDVKDLIQILASTRKEVEEIFCARTRSGRMRDKLQSQSVQLAQQTIDLFHNIASMRTA